MDGLKSRFVLKRHPVEAERARGLVVETCGDLVPEVALTAQLLVSELFTNALDHGSGLITLTFTRTPDELRAEVTDHSEGRAAVRLVSADQERGRGLLIVEALAHAWGVIQRPEGGKSVWFTLNIPA
jgi:anti-sigma regulatory factor (Ser/Thr protein kinase)